MALIQMRRGRHDRACATATAALKAARAARQRRLEAMALFRLAEAQYRVGKDDEAAGGERHPRPQALRVARRPRAAKAGRCGSLSMARSNQGRAAEADRAASEALALCRAAGDLYGVGNALNMLMFNEADIGTRLRLLNQALAAFEAAGYLERQAVITFNLGIAYMNLGLYRRARRTLRQAGDIYRRSGSTVDAGGSEWLLAVVEAEMGHFDRAREHLAAAVAAPGGREAGDRFPGFEPMLRGRLAFRESDAQTALAHYKRAVTLSRGAKQDAFQCNALAELAHVAAVRGRPVAALKATRRAVEIHRAHDLAPIQGLLSVHGLVGTQSRAGGQRRAQGCARGAGDGLRLHAQGHRRPGRRGAAPQLPEQDPLAPRDHRRAGSTMRASASSRPPAAVRISRARPACANPSSAWSTPACA